MCLLLGKRRRARKRRRVCSGVVSARCRLLRKSDVFLIVDPLTRWPFQKRTPQGQFRGPPTYTQQVWWRSIKGPRRSGGTNKQTNRQTDKHCSNYSMILTNEENLHETVSKLNADKLTSEILVHKALHWALYEHVNIEHIWLKYRWRCGSDDQRSVSSHSNSEVRSGELTLAKMRTCTADWMHMRVS